MCSFPPSNQPLLPYKLTPFLSFAPRALYGAVERFLTCNVHKVQVQSEVSVYWDYLLPIRLGKSH